MLVEFLSNEMSNREYTEMLDYISCILVSKMHDDLFVGDVKENAERCLQLQSSKSTTLM